MDEYNWLDSSDFRQQIRRKVSDAAARYGMVKFRSNVVQNLLARIQRRRPEILTAEATRSPSARRDMGDALDSTEFLIRYASEFAKRQGRKVLTWEDVQSILRDASIDYWPYS